MMDLVFFMVVVCSSMGVNSPNVNLTFSENVNLVSYTVGDATDPYTFDLFQTDPP